MSSIMNVSLFFCIHLPQVFDAIQFIFLVLRWNNLTCRNRNIQRWSNTRNHFTFSDLVLNHVVIHSAVLVLL